MSWKSTNALEIYERLKKASRLRRRIVLGASYEKLLRLIDIIECP